MSSIEVPPSTVSIKTLSSDEKKTLGQLKSSDVCLFLPIVLQPIRLKKRSKISIFFMNIVFVIILGCL